MRIDLKYWTITFEKKNSRYFIDDIFKIIPFTDTFDLNDLQEEILKNKGLFTSRDIWFTIGVEMAEKTLLTYNLATKQSDKLTLTDTGRIAKELGGFTEYLKYRKLQLTSVHTQNKINKGLLIIAFLGLSSPFIAEWFKDKFYPSESLPQPIHVIVDSLSLKYRPCPIDTKPDTTQKRHK